MINGMPNRPLYFYQKDIIDGSIMVSLQQGLGIGRDSVKTGQNHPLRSSPSMMMLKKAPETSGGGGPEEFNPEVVVWLVEKRGWLVVWNMFYFPIYWE